MNNFAFTAFSNITNTYYENSCFNNIAVRMAGASLVIWLVIIIYLQPGNTLLTELL